MKVVFAILLCFAPLFAAEYELKPVKVADSLWCVFGDLKPPSKENKGFVSNICWVDGKEGVTLLEAIYKGTKKAFEEGVELENITKSVKADEFSYLTNFEMLHPRNLYNIYGQFELGVLK
jgi:hypothetical protein